MTSTATTRPDGRARTPRHRATMVAGPEPAGPGTPGQTSEPKVRLAGVDAARGVALLGMMAVHSLNESTPDGRATLAFGLAGGRAAAIFAVLAGVGIAFTTRRRRVLLRTEGLATAAPLVTRALVVGLIGLLLGGVADAALGAVILPYYAVLFVLAIPLVFLRTRTLVVVAVAVTAGLPVLSHLLRPHLPVPTLDNPSFGVLFSDPVGLLSELAVTGEYPALTWTAYLVAGLVVGRLTLSSARVAARLFVGGAALAVAATVASRLLLSHGGLAAIAAAQPVSSLDVPGTTELLTLGGDGTTPTSTWWWLAVDRAHTGTPLDFADTIGTALATLGLLLLLGHLTAPRVRWAVAVLREPLAAAGSMTLTFYAAHILFINSDYDVYGPVTGYVVQVVAVLVLGLAWRATAGRGPLESIVTAIATGVRRQVAPVRRAHGGTG